MAGVAGGSGAEAAAAPAAAAKDETFTYSMWITSSEQPLPEIRTKSWEHANTKGASWPFPPHITLCSNIEALEADAESAMRAACKDISTAFEIDFEGVEVGVSTFSIFCVLFRAIRLFETTAKHYGCCTLFGILLVCSDADLRKAIEVKLYMSS